MDAVFEYEKRDEDTMIEGNRECMRGNDLLSKGRTFFGW